MNIYYYAVIKITDVIKLTFVFLYINTIYINDYYSYSI